MKNLKLAMSMYMAYCAAVGGKAFNGDPLPNAETLFNDPDKRKQADAWIAAANASAENRPEPIDKVVNKRDWNEFRKTGLFMFMNTILHAFGWAIVVEVENYKELGDNAPVTAVWPARVKYRGFADIDQTEMHERIADYLSRTAPNFPEEIK